MGVRRQERAGYVREEMGDRRQETGDRYRETGNGRQEIGDRRSFFDVVSEKFSANNLAGKSIIF